MKESAEAYKELTMTLLLEKTKSGKRCNLLRGLETLSEIALSKAEQMKIAIERSKTQLHSYHASGSGADEGTGVSPGVPDVPTDGSEDEPNLLDTESDNDGDDFVHPKFSTHDQEERQDEEDKQEEGSDLRVQTPSHYESTDDEESDEVTQEGRNTEIADAPQTNVQGTQVIEDTHVIITAATPEVQQQSSSVSSYVPITTNVEMPPSSVTTLPPPPIPLVQPQQQTPVPTPTIVPIDTYLANKMNEAVKTVVQLQSDRLRSEAQADNEDFINKIDENIRKIIKEQVKVQVNEQVTKIFPRIEKSVNEQLEAEVLIRSSNEAKTSHAVAANLSELELKKILIDKMKNNKSIDRSVPQKNLYKALVDAYESDKDILASYGDTVTLKRRRDDEDEDEEPSAGSNRGSKRRRAGKEPESTSAPKEKTSKSTGKSKEGSKSHQTSTGNSTLDKNLAQKYDTRESFNELMDTPLDFSAFVMNRLKVDTLTPELLAGLTFELMKESCKSLVELEYFLEKVCKATTDKLDWNNPEGQQYPHDQHKPLPLIPNSQGRCVLPFDHFINNDLAYLRGGSSSRTYATSVTKTKATDYGHVKWIEDLVSNTMWSPVAVIYDKHTL
ncbi:hypothetical protein Tco_0901379 [Tanacetum coccineum]